MSFSVVAASLTRMTYQWRKNGADIPGATDSTYTIYPVQQSDAGFYSVEVINGGGSAVSSDAALTVLVPAGIATQPQSKTAMNGQNASFYVVASGTSPFTYKWRFNGTALSGATGSALTIANVATTNAGNYTVVVMNSWGSITSAVATLTVLSPPSITTQPQNQTVLRNNDASFSVVASGTATLYYQWRFGGTPLAGATTSALTVSGAQNKDVGSYTVVVTNAVGSVTSAVANLTVVSAAVVDTQPQSQTVAPGQNASFSVVAGGSPPLSYQWSFNGTALSGATGSTLSLTHVQTTAAGDYSVVVSNPWSSNTSAVATLTVANPPPQLSAAAVTATGFTFQLSVPAGSNYVVLASTNLKDWTPICTNVALAGSVAFTDSSSSNYPVRFYRAMLK